MATDHRSNATKRATEQGDKEKEAEASRFDGMDYYAALGVGREATLIDIQRAYRRLALRVHPDRQPNAATLPPSPIETVLPKTVGFVWALPGQFL